MRKKGASPGAEYATRPTTYARPIRRLAVVTALLLLPVADAMAADELSGSTGDPGPVLQLELNSIIHPVAAEILLDALAEADRQHAEVLVVELATPGGLLTSTREMFSAMLEAKTPVVIYISPQGSQAASAGFFLLMAADVAAMAPGTNIGAAHPVGGQGEDIEGVMAEKVEQDAAATIRSLAEQKGRNQELAQEAVVESRSFTAKEALDEGLIDLIADDIDDLLEAIDGRVLEKNGEERTLRTADAQIQRIEIALFQRLRAIIAHPNVAYLLLSAGGLGLYFEFSNPGSILPGVLGAICVVLAFYALSLLPVNYAGVALLLLAVLFFLLEIKAPSFGLLTLGGVLSLVLGSVLLFDSPDPAIRVSFPLIAAMAAAAGLVSALLMTLVVKVHKRQASTGREGLIHETGIARTELAPRGKVAVHGEIWDAVAEAPVAAGDAIEIVAVEGMTLKVQPSQ